MVRTFNVSFDEENLKKIDAYRKSVGSLSRSKFLETAVMDYISAKELEPDIKEALESLAKSFEDLSAKAESIRLNNS